MSYKWCMTNDMTNDNRKQPPARARASAANPQEPAAVWVKVSELMPWAKNPRKNDEAAKEVARSIKRFGFGAPLLARRENGEIIGGHTRLKAAAILGLDVVPVRYLDLDPAEAHLLALADNKLGEKAEWDDGMLADILREYRDTDPEGLNVAGWSDDDVNALLAEGADVAGDGIDEADADTRPDELQRKWSTSVGQLWVCGRHRLVVGDSRDPSVAKMATGGALAQWMWTDPPYGVSYVGKTDDALEIKNDGAADLPSLLSAAFGAADAVLANGSPIYVAHAPGALCVEFGKAFIAAGWHFHETLIWVKDSMVLGHCDYHLKHEPIIYGWKGKNRTWFGDRDKVSTLEYAKPSRSELHPTMKPVGLVVDCLRNSAPKASLGYEPFSGSGTTLVAAEQCGLSCAAVELDPRFAAVAIERLSLMGVQCAVAM